MVRRARARARTPAQGAVTACTSLDLNSCVGFMCLTAGVHLVRVLLAADVWLGTQEATDKQKAAENVKDNKAAPPGPTEEARHKSLDLSAAPCALILQDITLPALVCTLQEAAAQEELEYLRLETAFLEHTSGENKGQAS